MIRGPGGGGGGGWYLILWLIVSFNRSVNRVLRLPLYTKLSYMRS